jgi:colicin import membrane protein
VTTTWQHIADLPEALWVTLTRQAAADAVAAAERHDIKPPPELVTVAAMSDGELLERRKQAGPTPTRLSPMIRLVNADHLRHAAEGRERDAHQDKLDAEAAASAARAEADEAGRAATAAREKARAIQAQAAQKDVERAAERTAHEETVQHLRGEIEQLRTSTAAELAAAREQVAAAEARAEQRAAERVSERTAHEQAIQRVRDDLKQAHADAATELAAAREQVIAAEARAEQRTAERTAERAHAEEAFRGCAATSNRCVPTLTPR